MSDTPQFKEGEVYRIDELPDNQMNKSGKLEWVDDEQLALCTEDRQQVILWFSHVKVKEVKYITEDGKLLDERPE